MHFQNRAAQARGERAMSRMRIRYNLRMLLVVLTLASLALAWSIRERPYHIARHKLDETFAAYQSETAIHDQLCNAAAELYEADANRLFRSRDAARLRYVAWLKNFEIRIRAIQQVSLYGEGGREEALQRIRAVRARRQELEREQSR